MCENVEFLCFWVFVKIWILFQSQDGSDDHDSPCVWWPALGSFSTRGWADRKVSWWLSVKLKIIFLFVETYWSTRTRLRDCLKPWMRTVRRYVLSRREISYSSKFLLTNILVHQISFSVTSSSSRPASSLSPRSSSVRRRPTTSWMI